MFYPDSISFIHTVTSTLNPSVVILMFMLHDKYKIQTPGMSQN